MVSAYNSTPHSGTKEAPYFLMFGQDYTMPMEDLLIPRRVPTNLDEQYHEEVRLRMRLANEEAARQIAKQFEQAKKHYDKGTKLPQFNIGDTVYLKIGQQKPGVGKKFATRWDGPYQVVRQTGPVNYEIQMGRGKLKQAYAGKLKTGKLRNGFPAQKMVNPEESILDEVRIEATAKKSGNSGDASAGFPHVGVEDPSDGPQVLGGDSTGESSILVEELSKKHNTTGEDSNTGFPCSAEASTKIPEAQKKRGRPKGGKNKMKNKDSNLQVAPVHRYNLRTRVKATDQGLSTVENFENLVPVDESQSDHREILTVGPKVNTLPDKQKGVGRDCNLSRGVTREELVQAFESWTIFPEELAGIQEYLEEARLRESHPDWLSRK